MKGFAGCAILLAFLAQAADAGSGCRPEDVREVRIGHRNWQVETAVMPEARLRGLSGRAGLDAGHAMLFVLPEVGIYGFWMKDMLFPIDLAWITPLRTVAGVESLQPCPADTCPIHYPPEPVAFVLETPLGEIPEDGEQVTWLCSD